MGNQTQELLRFRVHPATVPPMPPYWWKSESPRLRSAAVARRQAMSHNQHRLWKRLSENQVGTQCLRGVVVSGHVVDFFFPEARLIVDRQSAPRFLGLRLAWMTVSDERLAKAFEDVVVEIRGCVTDRAGVVAYTSTPPQESAPMPPPGSPRWRSMIEAAIHAS